MKNDKKALFFLLVLTFWVTFFSDLYITKAIEIQFQPKINYTCSDPDTLYGFANWTECENATSCIVKNYTQYITCANGCDTTDLKCNSAPYINTLIVVGIVVAILIFLVWVVKG